MGSDIFTWKCEAHNLIIEQRRSCPVCVSAKRSQLHAANLAHMPRYLFEQQLDLRPNPMKEVACATQMGPKSCVNKLPHEYSGYFELSSSVQSMLNILAHTEDSKILTLRKHYERQLDGYVIVYGDHKRVAYNAAIDLWFELKRLTHAQLGDDIRQQFEHFQARILLEGQRLLGPAQEYTFNFPNSSVGGYAVSNSTTRLVFSWLERNANVVGPDYYKIQESITYGDNLKSAGYALWAHVVEAYDNKNETSVKTFPKIKEQFIERFVLLYRKGWRLALVQKPVPAQAPAQAPVKPRTLVDEVYDYLMTSNKELYHKQCLLEAQLDTETHTLPGLLGCYRALAAETLDKYARAGMPGWELMSAATQRDLQTRLAQAYNDGARR